MSSRSACPALDDRIARLRELAQCEPRLEGVLLYGSWTLGEADAHSDIEAYLYVQDEHVDDFDGPAFLAQLAPLELAYTNMHGILAVVFDDLMRGEFHITAAGPGIDEVPAWEGAVHRPPEPATTAQQLTHELANWTLMLAHVLARGEVARAHAALHIVIGPLQLQLCRLLRGSTAHWLTPSRAMEQDLPAADRARYTATTSAALPQELRAAARSSWRWSRDLSSEAAERWGIRVPSSLHERIGELLAADR
jgi:lincosamide nucleotidyltransferase